MQSVTIKVTRYITRNLFLTLLITTLVSLVISCGSGKKSFETYKTDGLSAFTAGEDSSAVANLTQALRLKPTDKETLYFLGIAYGNLAEFDSSISYLRKALKLHGPDKEIAQNFHTVAVTGGRWDMALDALNEMARGGVPHERLNEKYYKAYMSNRQYFNASQIIDTMLKINPERADLYLRSSDVKIKLGEYNKAEMHLQEAMRRFGPTIEAYSNLAVLHAQQERMNKAELFFRKALALDSNRDASWMNLANLLSRKTDSASMREAIAGFRRLDPDMYAQLEFDTIVQRLEAELGD